MDVDVVADTAGLDALEDDWRRLDAADPRAELYTGFDCVRAWWAAYGGLGSFTPHVLVARQNGAVVGILPLALRRRRVRGRERTILRWASHGDWMAAVVDPEAPVATVLKAFLAHVDADDSWEILQLDHVRAGSHLCSALLSSDRWNRHLRHQVEHPRILLDGLADLGAYERERGLPSKTRKYRNKLMREHDVRFVVRDGDEDGILDRLADLHAREKEHLVEEAGRDERHSWSEDPQRRAHYAGLFATPGLVRTFCYEAPDGRLLAARSTFRHRRTLLSWTSAYDPALRDYRLGKVIQLDVLEHVLADGGTDVFDFGSGRYPWKFEWTEDFTSSYTLRVEREDAGTDDTGTDENVTAGARAPQGPDPAPDLSPRADAAGPSGGDSALAEGVASVGRAARRVLRRGRGRTPAAGGDGTRGRGVTVWHLARPGEELLGFGAALSDPPGDLVLVHAGVGLDARRRQALDAELGAPVPDDDLTAAVRAELLAAAAALGVAPERVHLADGGSRAAGRAVAAAVVAALPAARHRVLRDDDAPWLAEAVRQAAEPVGAVVEVVPADPGGSPGAVARAVVAAYRTWDPDAGRYAVNRSAASRYLVAVGADPADPRARDLG